MLAVSMTAEGSHFLCLENQSHHHKSHKLVTSYRTLLKRAMPQVPDAGLGYVTNKMEAFYTAPTNAITMERRLDFNYVYIILQANNITGLIISTEVRKRIIAFDWQVQTKRMMFHECKIEHKIITWDFAYKRKHQSLENKNVMFPFTHHSKTGTI